MSDSQITTETVIGIGGALVSAVTGAVVYLWRQITTTSNATQVELTKQRDDIAAKNEESTKQMIVMSNKIGLLEGKMSGHQQARKDMAEGLRELSEAALGRMVFEEPDADAESTA